MATTESPSQPPKPDPALRLLDRFDGTWDLRGRTLDSAVDDVSGRTTFEWLPGSGGGVSPRPAYGRPEEDRPGEPR
jgi:hypothetical protein